MIANIIITQIYFNLNISFKNNLKVNIKEIQELMEFKKKIITLDKRGKSLIDIANSKTELSDKPQKAKSNFK